MDTFTFHIMRMKLKWQTTFMLRRYRVRSWQGLP